MESVSETVPRRDAGPELTGTYLQRVSETDLTTRIRTERYRFLGMYKSVNVPSNASAANAMVSESVG